MTAETRRKIIMEESNRIRQIKANTIFTLPLELMKEEQRILNFADIISFPFIKVVDRDRNLLTGAVNSFEEFVFKRIDPLLFDGVPTVHLAIQSSGGSPRQLLRIIEQASWQADPEVGQITHTNMQKAIERLGNSMARYIEPSEFDLLKDISIALKNGEPIGFDSAIQKLLEKEILFEYNDGSYKCVNPLLEVSKMYKHKVLSES